MEDDKGALADGSYFEIFNYPLQKGDPETALTEPNTIVLTETLTKKIFGDGGEPIGKTLSAFYRGEEALLTVTGDFKRYSQEYSYENQFSNFHGNS